VARPKSAPATATTARQAAVMIAGTGGRTIAAPTADTTDITGRRALNAVVVWPVHGTAGPRGGSDVAGPAAVSGLRDRSSRAPRPAAAPPIRKAPAKTAAGSARACVQPATSMFAHRVAMRITTTKVAPNAAIAEPSRA